MNSQQYIAHAKRVIENMKDNEQLKQQIQISEPKGDRSNIQGDAQKKVVSTISDYGLVADKEYVILFEYDSVYEVQLDNGKKACRNKGFFKSLA